MTNIEIILSVLSIVIALGGYAIKRLNDLVKSYSKSYGNEIGKIDANTHKLKEIQLQLSQSVEISESIKKEISHSAWRDRELELLKREKLEQYLLNYYEAVENLSRNMKEAFFCDETPYDKTHEAKISMLQKLYLPELDQVHREYLTVSANFGNWIVEGRKEILENKIAGKTKPTVSQEVMDKYPELLAQANKATAAIEEKVTEVARSINVA
ncbi:hypothetical protein L2726_004712 [Vibrio parahaemolyticus]|nr:hypothetical protein [Vibrio parahaemolyticus]EIT7132105.1 hypothetical protein [Vibrio parahaemolyticus]EIZ4252575.1 hypothetical protein [Vibrio parahaemolyticus]